jgi:sporulation protein YlmC with PRC-barrel domain
MKTELRSDEMLGHPVVDPDGRSVGVVSRVYFDNRTREPEWIEVRGGSGWRGRLGLSRSLVPTEDATRNGESVRIPYSAEKVRRSPKLIPGEYLSTTQEARLCYHYGSPEYGHGAWSPHTGAGWPVHRWFFGGPRYGWMAGQERLDDERRTGGNEDWGRDRMRGSKP